MMGDLRVALRTRPSGVASFGRMTHAPADSKLVQSDDARSVHYLRRAALGSVAWEYPQSFPKLLRRRKERGAAVGVVAEVFTVFQRFVEQNRDARV